MSNAFSAVTNRGRYDNILTIKIIITVKKGEPLNPVCT